MIKSLLQTISRREWYFVAVLAAAVMALTVGPLVYGWLLTPDDFVFTGTHFVSYDDWFVYYSYLEQARQGNWLFFNLFTSEPHAPVLHLEWLAVGLFAKTFNLSNVLAFNAARLLVIPIFFIVAYCFIAHLFDDKKKRRVAALLLAFGSGLGFLFISQLLVYPANFANGSFHWPIDWWVPEATTFLTLYYSAHHTISLGLMLLIFLAFTLAVSSRKARYSVLSAAATGVLFFYHPYHVMSVLAVSAAYGIAVVLRDRTQFWNLVRHGVLVGLCALPAIGYFGAMVDADWVMAMKAVQNLTPSPPLWLTLAGYGLLVPFALVGGYQLVSQRRLDERWLLVLVWPFVSLALMYSPLAYQRRMSAGLHVPLVMLATEGLWYGYAWLRSGGHWLARWGYSQRYLVLMALIVLLSGSAFFQLAADALIFTTHRQPAYMPRDVVDAATWLRTVDAQEVILSYYGEGVVNVIPAYAGRMVYVGHRIETVNVAAKSQEVEWFFGQNHSATLERAFLKKRNIGYLFYGPTEQAIGSFDPAGKPYLREVYRNQTISIYQVL